MRWSIVLSATPFLATAVAVAVPRTHVVHEERAGHSSRWIKRDRAPGHMKVPVRIGLQQSNLENAQDYLLDVSDPNSANYGKHWTPEQVVETFKPKDETIVAVREWLVASGIPNESISHSDNKAWFAFHASVEQMENLLHTEYHEYEDSKTGGVMPATHRYHVPQNVQAHVDYITPGTKLLAEDKTTQKPRKNLVKREPPSGNRQSTRKFWQPDWMRHHATHDKQNLSICDVEITPACVAALYHIPPAPHRAESSNSMGIFEVSSILDFIQIPPRTARHIANLHAGRTSILGSARP